MTDLSRGACAGLADETFAYSDPFYPEPVRGRPTGDPYEAAKAVCDRCPIRDACLQDALSETVQWGYRAGMTPEQREQLRKGRPIEKQRGNNPTETDLERRMGMYLNGLNDREIAVNLGVSHKTILAWRKQHDLPPNAMNAPHSVAQTKIKWELWRAGMPDRVIGEAIGTTGQAIRRWRQREGLKPGPAAAREKVPA